MCNDNVDYHSLIVLLLLHKLEVEFMTSVNNNVNLPTIAVGVASIPVFYPTLISNFENVVEAA